MKIENFSFHRNTKWYFVPGIFVNYKVPGHRHILEISLLVLNRVIFFAIVVKEKDGKVWSKKWDRKDNKNES